MNPCQRNARAFGQKMTRNIELMREIWGPVERGESHDLQPFFGLLADDFVFELPVGALQGKQAFGDYLAYASERMDFDFVVEPLEYLGEGDRVVMLGDETFTARDTGLTHRARWAWALTFRDGQIARILHIQDLSGISEIVREAVVRAQASSSRHAGTE